MPATLTYSPLTPQNPAEFLRTNTRRYARYAETHPVQPLKGLREPRAASVSYRASVPAGQGGRGATLSYRASSPDGESLPCGTNGNISVSQSPDHCSLITAHWSFTFSAKERDPETGYSYFGSRYYSSDLSIWLSVDPMSDKYPSLSPYVYCANNPVKLVDPNGEEISTHTDKDGNVLAVYNDGILGIFVHTQAEIDDYHNGVKFQNNYDQMIGYSLCVSSFAPGDKIDFGSYQAKQWLNIFEGSFCTSFTNPLHAMAFYASEAGNGGIFDPKSKFSNGSQLSEGIYVSPRDLGNFAAGYFGRSVGLSKETTLASFGAFQLAKNNKKEFIANFHNLYKQALSTQGQGIEPPQKTYGEAAISNYFQRLGYENIRTMSDFEKKYEQIWKD